MTVKQALKLSARNQKMLNDYITWVNEKGYKPDDARFCTVKTTVPGIRALGTDTEPYNPLTVKPIEWDIWPKNVHVVLPDRYSAKHATYAKAG